MDQMKQIREHFETEAKEYDEIIQKIIPYYNQMVEALVSSLAFDNNEPISVIDLGCGTGTISKAVKTVFPNASVTCLDIAENMLEIARFKLKDDNAATFIHSDFYNFSFDRQYQAIVSSLALHHLVTEQDKLDFYRKIHGGLKDGGVFVNADVVLATDEVMQKEYMEKWKAYMLMNVPVEEVEGKWIPKHYEEDRPAKLTRHFEMLKEAGFKTMDVVWKYYNFAVYVAKK